MAVNAVYIDFVARGMPQVSKAIRSISDAIVQAESRATSAVRAGGSAREREANKAAAASVAAWQRAAVMANAAQRAGLSQTTQNFKAESRAAQQTASERIAAVQRVQAAERRTRADSLRGAVAKAGVTGIAHSPEVVAKAKVAGMIRGDAVRDQAIKAGQREAEKAALSEERAAARVARAKVAAMRVADREADRARAHGDRVAEKLARDDVRRTERTEREKNAAASRWVRRRESEQRRADAEAARRREKFAATVTGAGGRAIGSATSIVGRLASGAFAGVTGLGGGYGAADSVQRSMTLRGKLADVANRAIIKGDKENAQRVSVDELQAQTRAVGARFAIDPEKAAAGLDKFASKTGNLARGRQLMAGLAEMSRAGAGDLDDLADAAGDVFNTDTTQNAEQVLATMRALAGQGKIGAVEMKDLASQMAKLGAAAGQFQGDAGKNMATMGGLAQLARQSGGAASAPQAANAVQSLTNQFYKNARVKGFAALGVQTKDEKTGLNKDLDQVLIDVLKGAEKKSRAGGHGMRDFDVVLGGAIADVGARRAVNPLAKAYKEAGGGEAGTKAAQDLLKQFAGASMSKEEIATAAAERMKEADAQLEIAMQKLRNTTADSLTPVLITLTGKLTELVPLVGRVLDGFVKLASWASSNPFSGFAGLVTAFFIGELTKAAIANTIKTMLAGGVPGGVPGAVGAGGIPGGATGASGAAAGGVLAMGVAMQVGSITNLADERYGAVKAGQTQAQQLAADIASGDPAKAAEARRQIEDAKGKSTTTDKAGAYLDTGTRAAMAVLNPISYLATKATDYGLEKSGVKSGAQRSTETLQAAEVAGAPIDKMVDALKAHGDKLDRNSSATEANTRAAGSAAPAPPGVPSGTGPIKDSGR